MAKNKILPAIFGIKSTSLTVEEIDFFKQYQIQGIILFSRNIESKQQLLDLTTSIKSLYKDKPDLPIFVDQEGGRVARIKPPIAKQEYPTAQYFADLYLQNKEEAITATQENYFKIMKEAKELGCDSLCAPVCDLNFAEADDIIGDRSFGTIPEQVIDLASAAIDGISKAGGIPFIKHLPGHGRALVDSHYELPHVDTNLSELEKTDFLPFKELQDKNPWGMTAHIVYSAIDPDTPITMSKKGIDYIRRNIFDGIIVTDDIGMLALHGEVGIKKSLLMRLTAAAKKSMAYAEDYCNKYEKEFLDKFNIEIKAILNDNLHKLCQEKESEITEEFLNSLASASKQSIESGCNYVLHCSGDIKEMHAIAESLMQL